MQLRIRILTILLSINVFANAQNEPFGNNLYFEGAGNYISTTNHLKQRPKSQLTIEFWIRPVEFSSTNVQEIISNFAHPTFPLRNGEGYRIIYDPSKQEVSMELHTVNSRGVFVKITSTENITFTDKKSIGQLNEWSHIVFRYNGDNIETYFNGTSLNKPKSGISQDIFYASNTRTNGIEIGKNGGKYRLDELRIWNKALSDSEIIAVKSSEIEASADGSVILNDGTEISSLNYCNDLVAYYRFNEKTLVDNQLKDYSCNNFNGVYQGNFDDAAIGDSKYNGVAKWIGNSNGNWEDANNWANQIVPSAIYNSVAISSETFDPTNLSDVYFTGNYKIDYLYIHNLIGAYTNTSDLEFKKLKLSKNINFTSANFKHILISQLIENRGTFVVASDSKVSIVSATDEAVLQNFGTFLISSNEQGTGSVMSDMMDQTSPGVKKISFQRYVSQGNWHDIAPPVIGLKKSDFPESQIYRHIETNRADGDPYVALEESDEIFYNEGYLAYVPTPGNTIEFEGFSACKDVDFTLTSTMMENSEYYGWNLIGNPYTCALNWNSIISDPDNQNLNLNQSIYILKPTDLSWFVYNPSMPNPIGVISIENIPMGQGFFVQLTGGGSTSLKIKPSHRIHNNSNGAFAPENVEPLGKKSSNQEQLPSFYLELRASFEGKSDVVQYRWNQEANAEVFDTKYDAYKLLALNSNMPNLYFQKGETKTSINQEPETLNRALGFEMQNTGLVKISIARSNSFSSVILYDKVEDKRTDLLTSSYEFYYSGNQADRFEISFEKQTLDQGEIAVENPIKVFSKQKSIVIRDFNNLAKAVELFDLSGKSIFKQQLNNNITETEIETQLKTGVYLVRVYTEQSAISNKIIIE